MKIGQKISKFHVPKASSRQEFLPSRHALSKLTKGAPADRTFSDYAKATPSGANAPQRYADIQLMGELGIDLKE